MNETKLYEIRNSISLSFFYYFCMILNNDISLIASFPSARLQLIINRGYFNLKVHNTHILKMGTASLACPLRPWKGGLHVVIDSSAVEKLLFKVLLNSQSGS